MDANNKLSKAPFLSVWTNPSSQSTCPGGKQTESLVTALKKRADLTREAFGSALFEVCSGFTFHEATDCTLKKVREAQDQCEGCIARIDVINDLINAYFSLLRAERDKAAGRIVDKEPIDKLIAAYNNWMMS